MKNNGCFDCLNHGEGVLAENTGWYHKCKLSIKNNGLKNISVNCDKFEPNQGFQIGGYYSHMHFDYNKEDVNQCMEWIIHSDGEFPKDNPEEFTQFHICDFRQLESFVKFWGDKFRKEGIINDDDD